MKLSAEKKLILGSVKIQPTRQELDMLDALLTQVTDWEYVGKHIVDRGIGPLLFKKLALLNNKDLIPEQLVVRLQQSYYLTMSRNILMYNVFSQVVDAFTQHEIQIIALKGIYLSESMYKDIALRQFSDIDLLVKEEDGEKCISLLYQMGYTAYDSQERDIVVKTKAEAIHYTPMVKDGVSIELHTRLNRKKESYNLDITSLWQNARPVTINKSELYSLDSYDLLIHLCTHADKHFVEGKIQFTCFNDITNCIESYKRASDWKELTDRCLQYRCEEIVFKYIMLVYKYMHANVPDEISEQHTSLLTEKDEQLFINYLSGEFEEFTAVPFHFKNISELDSLSDKAKYILAVLFPDKSFMIKSYHIKIPSLYLLYYPYRWFVGLKGLIGKINK